jgi:hypothetical protein
MGDRTPPNPMMLCSEVEKKEKRTTPAPIRIAKSPPRRLGTRAGLISTPPRELSGAGLPEALVS